MITIKQLLAMPVGERIGGGFILTVKTTKKSVQLPNGNHIFTVVLFDNTGDMLADFKSKAYIPLVKGEQLAITVAEIQQSEKGVKLFVDQWDRPKGKPEPDYYGGMDDEIPDWETITKGKIRHGLVCSMIKAGIKVDCISMYKQDIKQLVEYIFTGE